MKASELIKQLNDSMEKHGDIEVLLFSEPSEFHQSYSVQVRTEGYIKTLPCECCSVDVKNEKVIIVSANL